MGWYVSDLQSSNAHCTKTPHGRTNDEGYGFQKKGNQNISWSNANEEGHGFRKKGNQDFQFYAMVAFMREFLLE